MNKSSKLIICGTSALFAAVIGLQAQTTSGSAQPAGSAGSTSANTSATAGQSTFQTSPSSSAQSGTQTGNSSGFQSAAPNSSATASTSMTPPPNSFSNGSTMNANSSATSSVNSSTAQSTPNVSYPSATPGTSTYSQSTYAAGAQTNTNAQTTQQNSTQTVLAGGGATETQVTTFVQQLDTQGPAVVQQISTQVGDLACSQDTVQNLVQALHDGQTVTITANGQSAQFNPEGAHMGYGEAYLTLALAAQELRNAGISSCATPAQWQAVLLGGPINVTNTSSSTNSYASAGSSNTFPGIVTLRNQGQGWGQIAQSANVQLGQVISTSGVSSNTNVNNNQNISPTGYSSSQMTQGRLNSDVNQDQDNNGNHKGEKKHWWSRNKNGNSASTHADTSSTSGTSSTPTDSTR